MNRPRESILNLFDPLFSVQPSTPPPCPSPDLGSDKENAAPLGDSPITLTKFFNRTYTRYKAQLPHPLPKGRLIDFGDPNVSYDSLSDDDDNDDDDGQVPQDEREPVVVHHEVGNVEGTPQRRPLADIALGDGSSRSSPVSIPKKGMTAAAAVFGSPSSFRLARPTPAPSSSPLASVINAINGTTTSPSSPPTPSAPQIAVAPPAAPPSPSPTRRQLRPGATLSASPDADARRVSVDLQESLSVHFDESSFDLLKDKILFPENDSLGDLEMDLELERAVLGVMAPARANEGDVVRCTLIESESEPDMDDVLSERLKDMDMASDDEEAAAEPGTLVGAGTKADDHDIISTPPVKSTSHTVPTPSLPVRQFIRPKANRLQAPTHPNPAPPTAAAVPAALPRRSARASISALPAPIVSTAAQRITKKANNAGLRKTALPPPLSPPKFAAPSSSAAGGAPPRAMIIGGVQRPTAHAKSASVSVPLRAPTSQQGRAAAPPPLATASKASLIGAGAGPRPSGLRPPTSRVGSSGIVAPRASAAFAVGGATRLSMTVGGGIGSRVGSSSGVMKPVAGKSDGVRMLRRV
ncbi:hypothetical protein BJY52DRAFT_274384 [Lactarius psammicola]|nr:hypothetical protein BJY52DRAFT_274384 [Lactarius psammicola]